MVFYRDKDLQKIMRLLNDTDTRQPQSMYVGGCVRDYLLKQETKDIDIATIHTPDQVIKTLKGHFKTIPVGIEHGTVIVATLYYNVQVTTLREDVETDGRHARVKFTNDWAHDAKRRDFTINTLLMDHKGKVKDPLGCGLKDLKSFKVKFVGNVEERVREDVLRILRYVRFHARFGRGALKKDYLNVFKSHKKLFQTLSHERITDEILKILSYKTGIVHLRKFGELKFWPLPLLSVTQEKQVRKLHHISVDIVPLSLAIWATSNVRWKKFKSYLKLSNKLSERVSNIINYARFLKNYNRHSYLKLRYKYGDELARDILIYNLIIKDFSLAQINKELALFNSLSTPKFLVTGKDLMAKGYTSGPHIGRILENLEKKWIASGFKSVSLDEALLKQPSRPTSRR